MKKGTILSVMALSALVYSCKKDDDKSTSELLLGKWNLIRAVENDHHNNLDHKDTTNYPAGNTVEFQSNGISIEKSPGYTDSSTYKLDGSKLILSYANNKDTLNISSISASDLQVSQKEVYTNGDFYERVVVLKK